MISIILFSLAAFFNACMDAFENENFFESIFRNKNQRFWYKRESWKWAKKIGGYKLDAWHISKSCMIICICFAIFPNWKGFILGIVWNIIFVLFYHKIFKIK